MVWGPAVGAVNVALQHIGKRFRIRAFGSVQKAFGQGVVPDLPGAESSLGLFGRDLVFAVFAFEGSVIDDGHEAYLLSGGAIGLGQS